MELLEIVWDAERATVECSVDGESPERTDATVEIAHGESRAEVGMFRPVVTIGRGQYCDLVIDHRNVSRRHARIEYRKGRFVYCDESTNGSWIVDARGTPRFVHNDECPLEGSGTIRFGAAHADASAPAATFRLIAVEVGEPGP
jgi:pSer/pThr/pTyr-binding forkhead associated (FHA) protein